MKLHSLMEVSMRGHLFAIFERVCRNGPEPRGNTFYTYKIFHPYIGFTSELTLDTTTGGS